MKLIRNKNIIYLREIINMMILLLLINRGYIQIQKLIIRNN